MYRDNTEQRHRHSRNDSIFDGKKMFITGSVTRDEKKWHSTIFDEIERSQAATNRKLLGKQDAGKAGLYGDDPSNYERRDEYNQSFLRGSKSMSDLELVPKDYNATKR